MRTFVIALKRNQVFLWTAAILLFASSVFGYMFHDEVKPVVEEALQQLKGIAETLQQDPSYWNTFITIFWNNLRATFVMLAAGFFFGVFPMFALLLNGFMLGYVLYDAADQYGIHPLTLFVQQILPHGILEFPAIIIASGFGLKFGWLAIRGIISIGSATARIRIRRQFGESIRQLPAVLMGIVVLLLFAAVIEAGLITLVQNQIGIR